MPANNGEITLMIWMIDKWVGLESRNLCPGQSKGEEINKNGHVEAVAYGENEL